MAPQKGFKHTPDQLARAGDSHRGVPSPLKGRIQPIEVRRKIATTMQNRFIRIAQAQSQEGAC